MRWEIATGVEPHPSCYDAAARQPMSISQAMIPKGALHESVRSGPARISGARSPSQPSLAAARAPRRRASCRQPQPRWANERVGGVRLALAGRPRNIDHRHERVTLRPRSPFCLRLPLRHAPARSLRGPDRARGQRDRQVRAGPRRVLGGERGQERLDVHHPFRRDIPRRHPRRCRGGPRVLRAIPDDGTGTGRRHAALHPGSGADHRARRAHGRVRLRRAAAAPRGLPLQPVRAAHPQCPGRHAERGRRRPRTRLGAAQRRRAGDRTLPDRRVRAGAAARPGAL